MRNKIAIIFGGAGFIGMHLSQYLLENKLAEYVYCVDIVKPDFNFPNLKYIHHDVRNPINIDIDNIETIYNLAAVHRTPGHANREYFETNIIGAQNICNFAEMKKVNTVVFTSSIAPYGASDELKTEESLPQPTTSYGTSKLVAEYIHRLWLEGSPDRKLIILRPGVVFGKGENGNFTRLYQSIKKRYFFYPGRKDTKKACIYVKDLVRLVYEMTLSKNRFQIYNTCYSEPPRIETIVKTLSNVVGVHNSDLVIPGVLLKGFACLFMIFSKLINKKTDIHPARVKKLMCSTNISGEKLANSSYKLKYPLNEAISDWYKDCNYKGLY